MMQAQQISWQSEEGTYRLKLWITERLRIREAMVWTYRAPISIQDLTLEILDYLLDMPFLLQQEYSSLPTQQDLSNVLCRYPDLFHEVIRPHGPRQWLLNMHVLHSLGSYIDSTDLVPNYNFWNEETSQDILTDVNKWYLTDHHGPMLFSDLVNVVQRRLWIQPLARINDHPLMPTQTQIKASLLNNKGGVFHKVQEEPDTWEVLVWL